MIPIDEFDPRIYEPFATHGRETDGKYEFIWTEKWDLVHLIGSWKDWGVTHIDVRDAAPLNTPEEAWRFCHAIHAVGGSIPHDRDLHRVYLLAPEKVHVLPDLPPL
jgi:hypothetical protein